MKGCHCPINSTKRQTHQYKTNMPYRAINKKRFNPFFGESPNYTHNNGNNPNYHKCNKRNKSKHVSNTIYKFIN